MIENVEVLSQLELEAKCKHTNYNDSILISIGNPHWIFSKKMQDESLPRIFKKSFKKILRLEFFDLPSVENVQPGKPKRIPQSRDVCRVTKFYESNKYYFSRCIIHCWGGISRSTAMAILILYLISRNQEYAIHELLRIRPNALPHEGILGMIDNIYGTSFAKQRGEIVQGWQDRLRKELFELENEGIEEINN